MYLYFDYDLISHSLRVRFTDKNINSNIDSNDIINQQKGIIFTYLFIFQRYIWIWYHIN